MDPSPLAIIFYVVSSAVSIIICLFLPFRGTATTQIMSVASLALEKLFVLFTAATLFCGCTMIAFWTEDGQSETAQMMLLVLGSIFAALAIVCFGAHLQVLLDDEKERKLQDLESQLDALQRRLERVNGQRSRQGDPKSMA